MKFEIKKATRSELKARVALIGVSGSGKTYDALIIAAGLARRPDGSRGRVLVIDTENRSASKYAEDPALGVDFDVIELDTFAPDTYVEAIRACEEAGAASIVIDSLSHAWMGKDGALEMKDKATAASRSGNSFDAWRTVTPKHNALVDALLRCKAHLVVTMRAKTEYLVEEVNGRKTPRKVGLAPVQRDGMEYEFDVVAEVNSDHQVIITKSRCSALAEVGVYDKADVRRMTVTLRSWLSGPGASAAPAEPSPRFAIDAGPAPLSLPADNGPPPSQASRAPEVDHYDAASKLLDGAATLPELGAAWRTINREHLGHLGPGEVTALTQAKDARKAALAAQPPAPPPDDEPPPDAPKPRGRRSAKPADATGDAASAANDGAASSAVDRSGARASNGAPLETRAQRRAYLATLAYAPAVRTSYGRRSDLPHYREDCAARLCALDPMLSQGEALAYLDAPATAQRRAA